MKALKNKMRIGMLSLFILISLNTVLAQERIPSFAGIDVAPRDPILGQPLEVKLVVNPGFGSLEGAHYTGRWCNVDISGSDCRPNNVGVDEVLSQENGWTFAVTDSGSFATKIYPQNLLTADLAGTYWISAEINGHLSTSKRVVVFNSKLAAQVASGDRYVYVCANPPTSFATQNPTLNQFVNECGLKDQAVIRSNEDISSLVYSVSLGDSGFFIYVCNVNVTDADIFNELSTGANGADCLLHAQGNFESFSSTQATTAGAGGVPVVTFISPTPSNGLTSGESVFTIKVMVESVKRIDNAWLTFSSGSANITDPGVPLVRESQNTSIYALQTLPLPPGTYLYRVHARDADGLEGASEERSLIVERNIARLEVTPSSLTINVGEEIPLVVSAVFSDGTRQDKTNEATCTSQNENIAAVNGCVVSGRNIGSTQITARIGTFEATASLGVIGVGQRQLSHIGIQPLGERTNINRNVEYSVSAFYSDNPAQGTLITSQASCTSNNTNVATINNCVAVPQGIGTTFITAQFQGRTSEAATLTVEPIGTRVLSGLDIEPDDIIINVNSNRNFRVFAVFSDGTRQDKTNEATCASTRTSVATTSGCTVTGQGIGTASITASFGSLSISTTIRVVVIGTRMLSDLNIEPRDSSIEVGQTRQYNIKAIFSNNDEEGLTGDICSVRNLDIATIDNCIATGSTVGLTTVIAEYTGGDRTVNDIAVLRVTAPGTLPRRECTPGETRVCFPRDFTVGSGAGQEDFLDTWHQVCGENGIFEACIKDTVIANTFLAGLACVNGQNWSCPRQFGVCQGSVQACSSGRFQGCSAVYGEVPGYETVELTLNDGLDNDCDGSIDEGGFCNNPSQQCGSLVGECTAGFQVCANNQWQACNFTNAVFPRPETLDNRDNDCDGSIDEGFSDPVLGRPVGSIRSCGTDIGACNSGQQVYTNDTFIGFNTWGICNNVVTPNFEPSRIACNNGVDDDCDNSLDEGCFCELSEPARSCGTNQGVCSTGSQACVNNIRAECSTAAASPAFESVESRCDDLDNDCDGTVDEGCACASDSGSINATSRACSLQSGVCSGFNQTCLNGDWQTCDYSRIQEYEESEGSCSDNLDNDCDGQIDRADTNCQVSNIRCSDGSLDGQCSNDQPKFCDSGALRFNCNECGCSSLSEVCSPDGSCTSAFSVGGPLTPDGSQPIDTTRGTPSRGQVAEKSGKFSTLVTSLLILLVILLAALGAFIYYRRKKKPKPLAFKPILPTNLSKVAKPLEEIKKSPVQEHSNVEQLYHYVLTSLERGKDLAEIRTASLDEGWANAEVEDAIKMAKSRLERKKALQDLFNYVKFNLGRGRSTYTIKDTLLKAGWHEEDISNALSKAKIGVEGEQRKLKLEQELKESRKTREKELKEALKTVKPKRVQKKEKSAKKRRVASKK